MSFLLHKEEEEHVTAKNRQAESLCVLKIECALQLHDVRLHNTLLPS